MEDKNKIIGTKQNIFGKRWQVAHLKELKIGWESLLTKNLTLVYRSLNF